MQSNYNNLDQNTNSMDTNNSESVNTNTNPSGIKFLQNKKFQSKKAKLIAGGLFVLFLVVALTAGYFLTQTGQDLRQRAAFQDYPTCPAVCGCQNIDGGCWCAIGGWQGHHTCDPVTEPGDCPPGCGPNDCIEQRTGGTSAGATGTHIFYCHQLSCTHDDGVTALRCDSSNSFAYRFLPGAVQDQCQGLPVGPGGYHYINDEPCECVAYQLDWEISGSLIGWRMGDPPQTNCVVSTPTPTPPLVERTLSGRVYCQDPGDTLYPIGSFSLEESTWTPGGLGLTTSLPVNADGNYSTNLTTTSELFAIRLPLVAGVRRLPDGNLSNGQPYSEMVGPTVEIFDYCSYVGSPIGYESCVVAARTNHVNFNFKYENCSPGTTITPTPTPPASPTPVQVYPQCISVVMTELDQTPIPNPEVVDIGQLVRFSCMADDPTLVSWYEFRVARRVPVNQSMIVDLASEPVGSNVSAVYEIMAGEYITQCRICSTNAQPGVCDTQWEPIIWPEANQLVPTNTPVPHPGL